MAKLKWTRQLNGSLRRDLFGGFGRIACGADLIRVHFLSDYCWDLGVQSDKIPRLRILNFHLRLAFHLLPSASAQGA